MKIARSLLLFSGFLACLFLAACALPAGEDYIVHRNDLNGGNGGYIIDYNLETYVPLPYIGDPPVVQVTNRGDLEMNILWKDAVGVPLSMEDFDAIEVGTIYSVDIQITPKNGYQFFAGQFFSYRNGRVTDQQDDGGEAARTVTVTYKAPLDPANRPVPIVDSDRDGYPDDWEVENGYDPQNPNNRPGLDEDSDGDGYSNGDELNAGTDPTDPNDYPGSNDDTNRFVYVKGGTFQMGRPDANSNERPVHDVTLSSFYMGVYEVTQADWEAVMGNNPSFHQGNNLSAFQQGLTAEHRGRLPVENVTWYEAVAYCNALSKKEGLATAYTINGTDVTLNSGAAGYRLPTEAEWEYAARGGKNHDTYRYSGSDNPDAVAWYQVNSGNESHPVGEKAANSLGLYDMSGNVWEWCWDWYGGYSSEVQTDPVGAAGMKTDRVNRGGSWDDPYAYSPAYRFSGPPTYHGFNVGLRLVHR
jgi:formylglycine-generating enzyme required for sulfatase activity